MPPKVKVTKGAIIDTAMSIVRISGASSLNARTIAGLLGCSTQPIFSNFATMDALYYAVVEKADQLYHTYLQDEINSGNYPAYKATGMAYIRFAKEERELFKLLFMRDRAGENHPKETEIDNQLETIIQQSTGLDGQQLQLFHLEIWAYVHGIAVMFATGYLDLDWDLVSKMTSDAYQGLKKQYGLEG